MKKELVMLVLGLMLVLPVISAEVCNPVVSLINQDPYPAIPGDYVKVVFQIDGIANAECGLVSFEVKEAYPFSLDSSEENPIIIRSGSYDKSFSSFYVAPYRIRIDEDAIDGDNPIEVGYSSSGVEELSEFEINIEDSKVDFEIFVKDYDVVAKTMTLHILNIGENDIEALTLEIPKQDNIQIKGPNRDVLGDLDSNEYTTADFEATSQGGEIQLDILYTDNINVRRSLSKTVSYDPSYFVDRSNGEKSNTNTIVIVLVVLVVIIFWIIKRKKKRRLRRH